MPIYGCGEGFGIEQGAWTIACVCGRNPELAPEDRAPGGQLNDARRHQVQDLVLVAETGARRAEFTRERSVRAFLTLMA